MWTNMEKVEEITSNNEYSYFKILSEHKVK